MKHTGRIVFSAIAAIVNLYLAYRRANDSSEKTVQKAGMISLFHGEE